MIKRPSKPGRPLTLGRWGGLAHNVSQHCQIVNRPVRWPISYKIPNISTFYIVTYFSVVFFTFLIVDPLVRNAITYLSMETIDLFVIITEFGTSHWYIVPVAIVLLVLMLSNWQVFSRKMLLLAQQLSFWCAAFLLSVAGGGIAVNLIKRMIGRARPKYFDDFGSFAFDPFAFTNSFASFPSGHATTTGSILVFLIVFAPKWRWLWFVFAGIVAASRVIIGAHYLSDILAGLAFGAGMSWMIIIYFTRRGLGFIIDGTMISGLRPNWPRQPLKLNRFLTEITAALVVRENRQLPHEHNLSMKPGKPGSRQNEMTDDSNDR